ncbi:hypothetical protein DB42_EE00100 [Neochlamydia sp. EPS4]|uniref:hypothetical protein n=1 Tax=Neochlamydia sp. EPS4 TaxID=1478175 RepID=UPI000583D25D|nr:hypothetical protein [Neochlamydia sp. EPS4]KIC76025.1 hypothetical protein DB42_EE00100 [Neochlamydia sp. EPS4]
MINLDSKELLETDFNALARKILTLENQTNNFNEKVDNLAKAILIKNERHEQHLKTLCEQNQLFMATIIKLKSDNIILTTENKDLKQEAQKWKNKTSKTQAVMQLALQANEQFGEAVQALTTDKENLSQENRSLKEDNAKLTKANHVFKQDNANLRAENQIFKDKNQELNDDKRALENENKGLATKVQAIEDKFQTLVKENEQLRDLEGRLHQQMTLLTQQAQETPTLPPKILKLMIDGGLKVNPDTPLTEAIRQIFEINENLKKKNKELQATLMRIESTLGLQRGVSCDSILRAINKAIVIPNKLKILGNKLVITNLLKKDYQPEDVLEILNGILNDYLDFRRYQPLICKELGIKATSNIETILKKMQEKKDESGVSAYFSRLGRSTLCLLSLGFAKVV